MRTLIINTYGGSLLLGATAQGAEIVGSYEDVGFGSKIQAANFPDVNLVTERRYWPKQDLSDVVVLAHPPCSAFSVQNNSNDPGVRGRDSSAFACTKHVLDYAMGNGAVAVAVESVMGALQGAYDIHQRFGDENGYYVYRILQNGAMFAPQWRERFWVVYVKKGAAHPNLGLTLYPNWWTVEDRTFDVQDGPTTANLDELLAKLKRDLAQKMPLWCGDVEHVLFGDRTPHHRTTGIANIIHEQLFPRADRIDVFNMYVGTFASGQLCYVNPDGLATCLLGSSWWYMKGRNLSERAYKRIMGFPADYVFPDRHRNQVRMFLSKGVIPAVARWVYGQLTRHLGEKHAHGCTCQGCHSITGHNAYHLEVEPDYVADFRFKKRHWPLGDVEGDVRKLDAARRNPPIHHQQVL